MIDKRYSDSYVTGCWMVDRVELGTSLTSVPGLAVIGQCAKACADHTGCDFFVYSPRILPTSHSYNDCQLYAKIHGHMEYQVGKITGYPSLAASDCPVITGMNSLVIIVPAALVTAPEGFEGCMKEYPGKNGNTGHGRNAYGTPFALTSEEVLLLNPRQCVELCRLGIMSVNFHLCISLYIKILLIK